MENNLPENEMRDKLKSVEFPFDPQAWEQMEAMLDKKDKRRGLLWWWFGGGAAALLLIALIGYGVMQKVAAYQQQTALNTLAAPTEHTIGAQKETTGQPIEPNSAGTNFNESKTGNNKPVATNGFEKQVTAQNTAPLNTSMHSTGDDSNLNATNNSNTITTTGTTSKIQHNNRQSATTNAKQNKAGIAKANTSTGSQEYSPAKLIINKNQVLALTPPVNNAEEKAYPTQNELPVQELILLCMVPDALIAKEDHAIEKKEEEVALRKKKTVFNYSLGVIANVTGTTMGNTVQFSKLPAYAVGFTHEFMLAKRFAFTNSVMFSQTSFSISEPKTVSFPTSPAAYTSDITELDIPIGVKVYPVSKSKLRYYIEAGIINHIKLKETFSYVTPKAVRDSSATTGAVSPTYPAQTDFTYGGGNYNSVAFTPTNNVSEPPNTSDFSINRAKRYYTSFYAKTGMEFIVQKHWVLFADALFYINLQQVGVQEKRKYNVGLSTGFRYQF